MRQLQGLVKPPCDGRRVTGLARKPLGKAYARSLGLGERECFFGLEEPGPKTSLGAGDCSERVHLEDLVEPVALRRGRLAPCLLEHLLQYAGSSQLFGGRDRWLCGWGMRAKWLRVGSRWLVPGS